MHGNTEKCNWPKKCNKQSEISLKLSSTTSFFLEISFYLVKVLRL